MAGLVTVILAAIGFYSWETNRLRDFGAHIWVIESGDSLGKVANKLVDNGVINNSVILRILASGKAARTIQAGEYRFDKHMSLREFLDNVTRGKSQVGIKLTILEGWNFNQLRSELSRSTKLNHITATMSGGEIMAELGYPNLHPEGRFFPDTYYYKAGETDLSVYRQAFELMQQKLDDAWRKRKADLPLTTKNEILIMASIIAKESYVAAEQPRIAAVFYNRLNKGMRLQTDPTVIYGLGEKFDGNLTRRHLKSDTPYNTYTRNGLPPTPISLPGWDALIAAARPARTDEYYFVASGGGRHHFSKTLQQHNAAVRKYILNRAANKQ